MAMNLGLEALVNQTSNTEVISDVELSQETFDIASDLSDLKRTLDSFDAFISVVDTIKEHGGYAGFESLIADKAQLDRIVGHDICKVSVEELADLYSNETVADALNKFGAKISAFFGRIGDRISNFFKTILPYKEKYLKELVDLKSHLTGKKFDEEKFASKKFGSALTKDQYNNLAGALKKAHDAMVAAMNFCNDKNLDDYLASADAIPGTIRTSLWGTVQFRPYLSWFKRATAAQCGFKAADVAGVVDENIALIKGIVDLQGLYGKWWTQTKQMEKAQSFERAAGNKEKAAEIRKAVSNMNSFFWTLLDSISAYEITVRRSMYFATYIGRAAKECIVEGAAAPAENDK